MPLDFKYNDTNNLHNYIIHEINSNYLHVGHININESKTYNWFLNTIQTLCTRELFSPTEVHNNLLFISMTEMSSLYINLRRNPNWKSKLLDILIKRFNFLNASISGKSEITLVSNLQKELVTMYPLIDIEFDKECNQNVNDIIESINYKYNSIIRKELQARSAQNLEYLSNTIKKEKFISKAKRWHILNSHNHFLKTQYFDIVQHLTHANDFTFVYEKNISVFKKQFDLDKIEINKYFKELDLVNEKIKNEEKSIVKIKEQLNYNIKEVENVKELRVLVDSGEKLENYIKTDF